MKVNGTGNMEQMRVQSRQMNQERMRMKDIMQQLPEDTRNTIKQEMQNLSPTQRKEVVSQISQMDLSGMSSDQIANTITNVINSVQSGTNSQQNTQNSDTNLISYIV